VPSTVPAAPEVSVAAPGILARARTDGVTGPAVVVLATALVGLGVMVDLAVGASLAFGTIVTVLVASVAAPAVVRFRSLATAAVLPPLLLAGAAAAIGRLSGQDHGNRELVLDVGTTLALWAPALFGGTVAGLLVVLVRIGHRLARR
jgi:hypothetical protein